MKSLFQSFLAMMYTSVVFCDFSIGREVSQATGRWLGGCTWIQPMVEWDREDKKRSHSSSFCVCILILIEIAVGDYLRVSGRLNNRVIIPNYQNDLKCTLDTLSNAFL